MYDLKSIRENPDAYDRGLKSRGLAPEAQAILALDGKRRAAQTAFQELQAKRNELSREIGEAKRKGGEVEALMAEVQRLKDELARREAEEREAADVLDALLAVLPNLPDADVPVGADETQNKEIRRHGSAREFAFAPKEHWQLGEALGLMDFEGAAKLSGARFVVLKGALARLERALAQFMLDLHTREFGYLEVSPPLLVRDETLFGTGNLPKFGDDLFKLEKFDLRLIPTAEVPLTSLVADSIVDETALPMRFTALTACFRSEAGAAGKDTRGMLRQHQFYKVELVSIAHPDASEAEHERMTACAEEVLKRLGLPYRTVVLCTGDMGFSSRKTYDIEVWLPGQGRYREISSCSNCGDFQARRMGARVRRAGEKGTRLVHTLNGSGLAVGRALIAILENFQENDGSVAIPEALHRYMEGITRLSRDV